MKVNKELVNYIENYILPTYESFDKGHQKDHIEDVWKSCLSIVEENHLNISIDMIYVISHYHDIGLKIDRENHHLHSAKIMLDDTKIFDYFTVEERHEMAEAIEDHRASSDHLPRSIYGKVIADGDRQINSVKIISRIIAYNEPKVHKISKKELFENKVYPHLCEKYGHNGAQGYLKLNFRHSNAQKELDRLIKMSKEEVYKIYEKCWDENK